MIKRLLLMFFFSINANALEVPELQLTESLQEQKEGNEFLQIIWNTNRVVADVETQVYLKLLGIELTKYSENPNKHFGFFMLDDNSINAFAGSYGYIGVHTGMLLSSDSEAELAGVLSHEISHVTQNHLARFGEKTDKQTYIMVAGMLAAALVDNSNASQAIAASTVAGTAQQSINFTREHEWEADRIGTKMLEKSSFDPKGMAHFFEKLKDDVNAQEFLRSHPLSINRISDAMQRSSRLNGEYRDDSFEYTTIKARLYYHQYKRIKLEKEKDITLYMQAYEAFDGQKYTIAKSYVDQLLLLNAQDASYILAGRIYSKLDKLDQAQQYFLNTEMGESAVYYAVQAYLDNKQIQQGIRLLKPYLKQHSGIYQSHKLLSLLYVENAQLDRAHIHNAEALVLQGRFEKGISRYERAKTTTRSQDLFDVINVKIERLENLIDLYKELP
ncbi:M48 family metalloprotease [Candidatus Thioglobus sp.]|uniref:M48 family metalloprotease n=1 Tax=Candidatus Thioglobus sp. TaxID=2026721 RepID=UPI001758EACF|nr:M48 family metalloprotease [Candidatus Thioglobus sp.]HIF47396.1 hypothetical protein [Candidatus Thioglobus sp.]HIL03334.1 hypothetical protein [Candidatus Thioglobus autotrophicus]